MGAVVAQLMRTARVSIKSDSAKKQKKLGRGEKSMAIFISGNAKIVNSGPNGFYVEGLGDNQVCPVLYSSS